MPDSQHLRNLLKQKELIEGHLAWIHAEIERETQISSQEQEALDASPIPKKRIEVGSSEKTRSPQVLQQSDALPDLLEQLGPDSTSASSDTKKGCFIYFGFAVAALAALITYIYTAY
ncbi:hypothetical protein MLD52_20410 [Puniceicoccaceae bacterium K14]|nr:hypothetical protein [Puniceicoccaceae bacterium K14]